MVEVQNRHNHHFLAENQLQSSANSMAYGKCCGVEQRTVDPYKALLCSLLASSLCQGVSEVLPGFITADLITEDSSAGEAAGFR